jgi:putative transcriptional regulator
MALYVTVLKRCYARTTWSKQFFEIIQCNQSCAGNRESLKSHRKKRGISAARLAKSAGVSRQTIYTIEAGIYLPNTLISLQLARALEVQVHDLFALRENERSVRAKRTRA